MRLSWPCNSPHIYFSDLWFAKGVRFCPSVYGCTVTLSTSWELSVAMVRYDMTAYDIHTAACLFFLRHATKNLVLDQRAQQLATGLGVGTFAGSPGSGG